jgi:hypothetical protein
MNARIKANAPKTVADCACAYAAVTDDCDTDDTGADPNTVVPSVYLTKMP